MAEYLNPSGRAAKVFGEWFYTCKKNNPKFNAENPTDEEENLYYEMLDKEFIKS
jgi:hypothetical protein